MSVSVFDIDGTLLDSLPLVLSCYHAAGVPDATMDDVRQHWTRWLPRLTDDPEAVRHRKTELYVRALADCRIRELPCAGLARELVKAGEGVAVVTAGCKHVIPPILKRLRLTGVAVIGGEVLPEDRPEALVLLWSSGTYYDDDEETCWRVNDETNWTAIPV